MSLPRHLKKELTSFNNRFFIAGDDVSVMVSRKDAYLLSSISKFSTKLESIEMLNIKLLFRKEHISFYDKEKYAFRKIYRKALKKEITSFENSKVELKRYLGFKSNNGKYIAEYKTVFIPKSIAQVYKQIQRTREENEINEARLSERIIKLNNSSKKKRFFPVSLRELVLARDNYQCQSCHRDKMTLLKSGLKLEVHHKTSWEEGGETTYENGIALCTACHSHEHRLQKAYKRGPVTFFV